MTEEKEGINPLLEKLFESFPVKNGNSLQDSEEEGFEFIGGSGEDEEDFFIGTTNDFSKKDSSLNLEALSKFFIEGRVNWEVITSLRKFREMESMFGASAEGYEELSLIESLMFKSGICTNRDIALEKMNSFVILRISGNLDFGNVHEDGLLFAEESDAYAFLWSWVEENYNPKEVRVHKFTKLSSGEFEESVSTMLLKDVPKSMGYDWLTNDFPVLS